MQITSNTYDEISENEEVIKKIKVLNSCIIGDKLFDNLNINGDWCTEESISQNICYGTFNPELKPYIEDDFLIFPKDDKFKQRNLVNQNQVVTVGNYFECLDYSIGGFIPQSSANFFFNNKREAPKGFFVMLILTLFTMFYEMTYGTHKRKN